MSHFATIKTQIKDIEALRDSCKELGFKLLKNAEARGYGNNRRQGGYVIKLKGPYDVALNIQRDGTYSLATDWWDGHVEKEIGKNYGTLLQFYGLHKAETKENNPSGLIAQIYNEEKAGCIF